jgi:hypothetical protein
MGITRQGTLIHWNYFLAIEEDLCVLSRFVDFSKSNDFTFSLEIARILMSASAEVDVILKQLCLAIDVTSKANNINEYYTPITSTISDFKTFKVIIPTQGLELQPWESWEISSPPLWWTAHNKVKHERHKYYNMATLKNCLNSIAGLYISVLYLYYDQAVKGELLQLPKLFNVTDEHFNGTSMGRFGNSFRYNLVI